MPINKYVANSSGEFGAEILDKIEAGFKEAVVIVKDKLNADKIDIIIVNAPMNRNS